VKHLQRRAEAALVVNTFIWGTTFVVVKQALHDVSPVLFLALRFTLATAALLVLFRGSWSHPRNPRWSLAGGALAGVFLFSGYAFQTIGLQYTTAPKSAFLTSLTAVMTPLLAAIVYRSRPRALEIGGVLLATGGMALMTLPTAPGATMAINRGDLLTLGCAVMFAFQIILMGRAMQKHRFEGIATVEAITCAVLMFISVPVLEHAHAVWSSRVIWAILVTGLLGTGAAFTIQAWAQQFTPPTHTALIFLLEPVFAWMTSYIVLHERLGIRAGVGALLILGGIVVSELKGSQAELQAEVGDEHAEAAKSDA